eukprot:1155866-Pelagomonas_calceolata.AAC.7
MLPPSLENVADSNSFRMLKHIPEQVSKVTCVQNQMCPLRDGELSRSRKMPGIEGSETGRMARLSTQLD